VKTSIVIVTYNNLEYIEQCVASIRAYTRSGDYEIIVVGNHSTVGTLAWLSEQSDLHVIENVENLGFAKSCNQGIELAQGDNILLLNVHISVSHNWLNNLLICLYSNENIGAVGSMTNDSSWYQSTSVNYSNLEEMHLYAVSNNHSNPLKWEERLTLPDNCMFIKRSVVEQIGIFDERFIAETYAVNDYSLRIRLAGYRLVLCKDAFIHYSFSTSYGENDSETGHLLKLNQHVYFDKWGFDLEPNEVNIIRIELIDQMDKSYEKAIRVLEIGCRCGGTLLKIKNVYPNAELYGIESNRTSLEAASLFVKMVDGNSTGILDHYEEDYFDYIILGDNLPTIDQPQKTLIALKNYLKADGKLLASVSNLMHYNVIRDFIHGTASKEQLGFYKLSDINQLFESSGYANIEITGLNSSKRPEDSRFVQELSNINDVGGSLTYDVDKFLVRAAKPGASNLFHAILTELQLGVDVEMNLDKLQEHNIEQVIDVIVANHQNVVGFLNQLAMFYLNRRNNDQILPFLSRAHELDHTDENTLYNLGYVFNLIGDSKMALQYLQLIEHKDDEVNQLIEEISQALKTKKLADNQLKFLLRRIENDIDQENNMNQIVDLIVKKKVEVEEIINVTTFEIIEKDRVFNLIGIQCMNNQLFDHVIPLFQASFEFNPSNQDTLYNLGFILYDLGEYNQAVYFLERVIEKNDEIERVISEIREGLTR
jgi:GT2 family glycosyltransferase/tetratricopeptide (TPR) repeat protein